MHPWADTGRVIAGRYRLEAPIGRGAMGVVWRARDQLLDRDVAVKEVQIADTLTDAERANAYQRTLREAKTAARLNHPAVVTVYDVAEDGGRPWIVMQLVNAQSLDQVLAASGPLSPRRAAEMARQLLSALSVAHAAGVMHRDVKPSNVLLGSDDRAVLTDFGIATFQGDPKLTQTGMVMGSPGFTAPERIRGEDASPASDLWSLGATIYAAVEGHGPFEKRGGAITTMSAIINEEAPEAPTAGALGPVIAALLRREPADRPDASAAARMITDVLPQLAGRTAGTSAGYEATALSASSRPTPPGSAPPGSVPPGSVPPGSVPPGSAPAWIGAAWVGTAGVGTAWVGAARVGTAVGVSAGRDRAGLRLGRADDGEGAGREHRTAGRRPGVGRADRPDRAPAGRVTRRVTRSSWGQGAGTGYPGQAGSAARPEGRRPISPPGTTRRPGRGGRRSGLRLGLPAAAGPPQSATVRRPGRARRRRHRGRRSAAGPGVRSRHRARRPGPAPGTRRPGAGGPALGWKVAVAALAIIGAGAGAATVVLLHQNHSGSPQGQTSATGRASGSAAGTLPSAENAPQIVNAINMRPAGPLPSGFTTITQPAVGQRDRGLQHRRADQLERVDERLPDVPEGSRRNRTRTSSSISRRTPTRRHAAGSEVHRGAVDPPFPGYHRLGLAAIDIRGTPGSYWKFTWTNAGVQQEAIDLLFVLHTSAGPQSYALYMTAPENNFAQMRPIFDEEVETFATVPS